jgi:hypothetical protein
MYGTQADVEISSRSRKYLEAAEARILFVRAALRCVPLGLVVERPEYGGEL